MVTDSIAYVSIPMPASKGFSKKKKGNRTAKLKQCKLDARREQWLSQVKKKGCKEEDVQSVHVDNEEKKSAMENLETKPSDMLNNEPVHDYIDSDSPSNSPTSHVSSVLSSNISGTSFTASSSSGSGSSCSGSITGEDEDADEDECLDDWEAMADALAASEDKPKLDLPVQNLTQELTNPKAELPKPKVDRVEKVQRAPSSGRAWKSDDAFRPQSLPNLAKQKSLPSGRNHRCTGGGVWARKSVKSTPKSCPICCEDLDITDSSFVPCGCGFSLCLFCHKRILEEDGRCPGCRKPYEKEPVKGEVAFRFARSCSMIGRF